MTIRWIPVAERVIPPWIKGTRPWVVVATFEIQDGHPDIGASEPSRDAAQSDRPSCA